MLIAEMQTRVDSLFDKILAKRKSLPFGGRFVVALRDFVTTRLKLVKSEIERILEPADDADFDDAVKDLITIARGNLDLGWFWNRFSGFALSSIQKWLLDKNNRTKIVTGIGALPPVPSDAPQ